MKVKKRPMYRRVVSLAVALCTLLAGMPPVLAADAAF